MLSTHLDVYHVTAEMGFSVSHNLSELSLIAETDNLDCSSLSHCSATSLRRVFGAERGFRGDSLLILSRIEFLDRLGGPAVLRRLVLAIARIHTFELRDPQCAALQMFPAVPGLFSGSGQRGILYLPAAFFFFFFFL